MSDTTFISGTLITSAWLNDVNDRTYHEQLPASQFVLQTPTPTTGFNYSYDTDAVSIVYAQAAGTLATGTVTFTTGTSNRKLIRYSTLFAITAITWASANVLDTFVGFPTTMAANSSILAIYNSSTNVWYRIG